MFAGFIDSHFDAYQQKKWRSNAFNLERMAVKELLAALGLELDGPLTAADGAPLACEVSVEHPALDNQKQVDSQQLYFTRPPDARQELDRVMDRSRGMAALLEARSTQRSHISLSVSVRVDHLFVGLALCHDADIDRRNLEKQLARPEQAQAFMALLRSLPPEIAVHGPGHATGVRMPACQAPLETVQQHLAALPLGGQTRWLTLGRRLQRAEAVALGNAIREPIAATLGALLPVYRFIAWTRENDHIDMRDRLDSLTERTRAVARSARRGEGAGFAQADAGELSGTPDARKAARTQPGLTKGDQVRIVSGMFSGRTGVIQELDGKGILKILVGTIQIKLEAHEVEKH